MAKRKVYPESISQRLKMVKELLELTDNQNDLIADLLELSWTEGAQTGTRMAFDKIAEELKTDRGEDTQQQG